MKKSYLLTLSLLSSSVALAAEDEHREHGAHEHGHAQMSVIVEKNELLISLESPAINIFGFEHKPENQMQHKKIVDSVKDLENTNTLITLDESANCSLVKTEVEHPFEIAHADDHKDEHKHDEKHDDHKDEHKHDEEHDEHKDEHKQDEEHDDHKDEHKHDEEHDDHKDEHKHDEESTHSDVDVEIAYTCKDASKLTKMDLSGLFKRFPIFEELDVQGIINGQQTAAELNKDQAVLSLK